MLGDQLSSNSTCLGIPLAYAQAADDVSSALTVLHVDLASPTAGRTVEQLPPQ
jgi:hypothetical protein